MSNLRFGARKWISLSSSTTEQLSPGGPAKWGLHPIYGTVTSRKVPAAAATVDFNGTIYDAWVTTAPHGRSSPAFRLWYDPSLAFELKRSFVMSYMRSLEGRLDSDRDVEHAASFWEFLDIEFDERQRSGAFGIFKSNRMTGGCRFWTMVSPSSGSVVERNSTFSEDIASPTNSRKSASSSIASTVTFDSGDSAFLICSSSLMFPDLPKIPVSAKSKRARQLSR